MRFREEAERNKAVGAIDRTFPDLVSRTIDAGPGDFRIASTLKPEAQKRLQEGAIQQNIQILRNRVNELGVAEPVIQQQGAERIVVQLPGVQDPGRAIRLLASTADGRFLDNDFVGNTFDVVANSRRIRAEFRGNHWDRYRGWDLDGDGTGDIGHHPVRLFALMVERSEAASLVDRSLVVRLIDAAERAIPALTPRELNDPAPRMRAGSRREP